MFALDVVVRTTPKAGHTHAQNEDASAVVAEAGRVAIADGASEGWQSGNWAHTLVQGFVNGPPQPVDFPEWLNQVRTLGPALPAGGSSWYVETKALQGAFSTLLGVSFEMPRTGTGVKWRALAVGDCCLFHCRNGKTLTTFPIESADDFGSSPALIGSGSHVPHPIPGWYAGRAELGDRFFLLTDALAEWLFRKLSRETDALMELGDLLQGASEAFEGWVSALRQQKAIRNDDTTLIGINLRRKS